MTTTNTAGFAGGNPRFKVLPPSGEGSSFPPGSNAPHKCDG